MGAPREDSWEVYPPPYDPQVPRVCRDAPPVQLRQETRQPRPAAEGQPERSDSEDERHGTAHRLLFTEPLRGRRFVRVRERPTARDWALELPARLDTP